MSETPITLYALNDNVIFLHLPQEGYIINQNTSPPDHFHTDDYFDRSILCALCQANVDGTADKTKPPNPWISAANITEAIKDFFKPDNQPTVGDVQTWLQKYYTAPADPKDIVKVIEVLTDTGVKVSFFPTGPDKKDKSAGNLKSGNKTKDSWGKPIAPPNPLPYKICCF